VRTERWIDGSAMFSITLPSLIMNSPKHVAVSVHYGRLVGGAFIPRLLPARR
jgi:hypothetical protein